MRYSLSFPINIQELQGELNIMSGYKIQQQMNTLKDSIYVLNGNFNDLEAHINELKNFRNVTTKINAHLETKRLVHNYLCSAVTLIDHTRIYITNIHKEKEFGDYQPKIEKTFIQNPLCCFIKDFRQYLQHFKLPEISFQANALSIKFYWSIKIKPEELLKFSGWKSGAKKFINCQHKSIDLHKVLKEYQIIVDDFYQWLIQRQFEIFACEFDEVETIKARIVSAQIKNLITEVVLEKFSNYYEFKKQIDLIWPNEDFKDLNQINQIDKMTDLLTTDLKLKIILQNNLEKLLL